MVTSEMFNELLELEESLWVEKTRFDYDYMDKVLSPDFREFGRSGKVYKREDTLNAPHQLINAKLPLRDFMVYQIGDNVFQVTYVSEVMDEELEIGNRSSIWLKTQNGWKLRFHQGTVVRGL